MKTYNDEDLLDFLMTSEFDETLSPDDYKFYLKKFRNFYRIVANRMDFQKDRMSQAIEEKEQMSKHLDLQVKEFNNEKSILINKLNNILSRKLTLKERLLGKIIEKNED